jgi:hypothetical protein
MPTENTKAILEQYRDASFEYDTNSSSVHTAETFGMFATFALIATFVFDVSSFAQQYVWLARFVLVAVAAFAFIAASRYEKQARSAQKAMTDLGNNNPESAPPS